MNFRFVILAAGLGSRMGGDIPKALVLVGGKPILQHLLDSVKASGVDGIPLVVVGHEAHYLCEAFGGSCEYVVQEKQLGTGHAVMVTEDACKGADAIIVLYGDHPFISPETLKKLSDHHTEQGNIITMMTVKLPHFYDWFQMFRQWGRVMRDDQGKVIGIREYKDASEEERCIQEVNPALFCLDATWLWENIKTLKNENVQKEYYLTDLIAMAVDQGKKLSTLNIAPEEAIGINTPQEKEMAEEVLRKKNSQSGL
ncbi:hypothetical protein A2239_01295 [Candidatus Uhrbacteria bacterium RIFOXYA2_FULL_40_9]|nr:MAG: Bifunctional protein GlmU [Candidatus Uhrbacteria bacterium GW2011_GWF2_40_263]OGL93589.1 MAG: hypothetical protein A2239_01295 [Candidatus Uhrbacteria bacterium RIFOXYA2_FULL_40_9]OGL97149.1 MAG: hypothetical protein A2332_03585 [Candidatus Uhrbacteria bacterium RIFOXYB2_FULL_41_18]HBK35074.1 hypothetical protein [Candidatus Uhrbacteria bacterium]HCB56227.1 hypothetical protein [Candidatus Uhrbacteria bacterium]